MSAPSRDPEGSNPLDATEVRVVARIAAGDRGAFATVYGAHKDALFSIAAHLLNDHSLAEDVVHDTFIALARHAGDLRHETSVRSWLVACTLNRSRDLLRRREIQRRVLRDVAGRSAEGAGPQPSSIRDEEHELLRDAVTRLPSEQREVVVLRAFSGLSFPAIAALVEAPLDTTHSRWRYALARLRRSLAHLETAP